MIVCVGRKRWLSAIENAAAFAVNGDAMAGFKPASKKERAGEVARLEPKRAGELHVVSRDTER